jgi:riboflavin biosynthesis pyrimidine reductase
MKEEKERQEEFQKMRQALQAAMVGIRTQLTNTRLSPPEQVAVR